MPIISNITSQNTSLNSTMDLVVNQGSTTVRLTAAQVISAIFSTAGDLLYAASSIDISRLAPPTTANPNNVNILHYSSGSNAPIWTTMSSGELITVTSAGNLTHLTPPTSDSILQYSTINGSVGPAWFTPGDGELLMSDADGDLEFLTIGTAGRLLQSTGGIPAWVGMSSHSIFVGSVDQVPTELAGPGTSGSILITNGSSAPSWLARGTSEQILSIVSGLPAWRASTAILSTILTAAGDLLRRSSAGIERLAGGSSAAILEYSTADGTIGPQWQLLNQGEIIVGTTGSAGAAGPVGVLAQPSAGAIMRYSTVDGSSGPEWFDLTSGQFIRGSSVEGNPIAFAVPSSGAVLTHSTVNGAFGPAWLDVSTGELITRSSDGTMKALAAPSTGSLLHFSTVDGTIGPAWFDLDANELIRASTAGILETISPPTSGAVLVYTTGDTSGAKWLGGGDDGQVLQTSAGLLKWANDETGAGLPSTAGITSGAIVRQAADNASQEWLEAGTSGQVLETTVGMPTWVDPVGGSGTTEAWQLRRETTLALAAGVWTALQWTVEDQDTDAFHSTATNSSLTTITSTGTYILGFQAFFGSSGSMGGLRIRQGTTILVELEQRIPNANTGVSVVTMRTFDTSGVTLTAEMNAIDTTNNAPNAAPYTPKFWGHKLIN